MMKAVLPSVIGATASMFVLSTSGRTVPGGGRPPGEDLLAGLLGSVQERHMEHEQDDRRQEERPRVDGHVPLVVIGEQRDLRTARRVEAGGRGQVRPVL